MFMCPSYMGTLDEEHSTRGRANALRLVMTGELDGGSTPDMARKLAGAIPSARCFLIPQARHMMPVERPDEVNSVLRHFLNGKSL